MEQKKILVLGLGLHGGAIGTIKWLASSACPQELQGAHIIVADKKTQAELASSVAKLKDIKNITYVFGEHGMELLEEVDLIIKNPGVLRSLPLLEEAKKRNIPIEMDSSLFFQYCPSKTIIGITGSKGKTTASSAIAHVLTAIFPDTVAVGIDGVSPLEALIGLPSGIDFPVVFELSSWRLEPLQEKQISPHIAVVTSLYKDHLNTYSSFEEYIEVKKQLIRNQSEDDIAILNADDTKISTWKEDVKGKLYWFSLQPLGNDEEGIYIEGEEIFMRLATTPTPALGGDSPLSKGEKFGDFLPSYEGRRGGVVSICKTSEIPHSSRHELRNKLPSLLIAILLGGSGEDAKNALSTMKPMKYRLEHIASIRGVKYINDSAATMPDATIAALASLQANPLILILGGSDKALEFDMLSRAIASHPNIKLLIWLPGTATDRMKAQILQDASLPSYDAPSMEDAVRIASTHAQEGDTVLLSPGATSFGLFLHEFDRGDAFNEAVKGVY